MSIRALHYITGDTPQSGFRRIGSSDAFPADQLPLLEHGDEIQERSRIESSSSKASSSGIRQISHLWEYQTGKYGVPVVIQSYAAIGTGRAHGFSEYVLGRAENIAETADAAEMIGGAVHLRLLDVETFMAISGREEISCPEEIWEPQRGDYATTIPEMEEVWRLTLLSRYWEQASIRAFSEDVPEAVRVNLGEFSEDPQEETEETIRRARQFFSQVICPGLPRQVQNIASMTAGVNCADALRLYTALEFDISHNMFEGETMMASNSRIPGKYRLNEAELNFISLASQGETPDAVQRFFERYIELTGDREASVTNIPFMADYRIQYALYCADRIVKEGHSFIAKAELMNEHGNPQRIRDARACYLIMRRLRKLLETEHHLNDIRKNLVSELLDPIEGELMAVMLEDMNSEHAEPFMLFQNEKTEFYRKYIYQADEDQRQVMIDLMVRDMQVSKVPQFVRCYPSVQLRTEEADHLNARLMRQMLPAVICPVIEEEKKKGKIENKYLDYLRSEEFADRWAILPQNRETKQAFVDFLREEIQDSQKHYLLYKISLKYLPGNELLMTTLAHFRKENTTPSSKPEGRPLKIAAYGAREYISGKGKTDEQCVSSMNHYYQECFREYGRDIESMADVVTELGGNTTEAMTLIFGEKAFGMRMSQEEVKAVLHTFGGENGRYARQEQVRSAFSAMIEQQLDNALEAEEQGVISWIGNMFAASAGYFTVDTTECLRKIFESGKSGERMEPDAAAEVFDLMAGQASGLDTVVQRTYTDMLKARRTETDRRNYADEFDWQCEMMACCPWKTVPNWVTDQRMENIVMVCEESLKRETLLDGTTMATMQRWMEEGGIQPRGVNSLQRMCEFWLERGNTAPTDMFVRFFERIDNSYPELQDRTFDLAKKKFVEGLEESSISFGDLVRSCGKDTERAGRRLDDLYSETRAQTDAYLKQHFSSVGDLGYLINEQEQIPENNEFHRSWQQALSERISRQQVELFNRQPNLDKLLVLRKDILRRTRDTHPALLAAYQVIDNYEGRLNQISEQTEYAALTETPRILTEMDNLLGRAEEVRSTLCSCLRGVNYPAFRKLEQQSFRHALCASMMRAILKDSGKSEGGRKQGGPDWSTVLHTMIPREEVESAIKSPYNRRHLSVLQRLTAVVDNVKLMVAYGMNPDWYHQLIRTIHIDSYLRDYQNALARNRKMAEMYQLRFSDEGLEF